MRLPIAATIKDQRLLKSFQRTLNQFINSQSLGGVVLAFVALLVLVQ